MIRKWNSKLPGVLVAAALVCGCATAAGQENESKEPPGIKVGEKAPDFKLKDQRGEERSLKELIGEREKDDNTVLALVFYRSADW